MKKASLSSLDFTLGWGGRGEWFRAGEDQVRAGASNGGMRLEVGSPTGWLGKEPGQERMKPGLGQRPRA